MRRLGRADLRWSRGSSGHVCCLHDDAGQYGRHLAAFFAEGIRDGLRVTYVGPDGRDGARGDLADVGDVDRLLSEGALQILSTQDVYGSDGPVDADQVVARYAAATERALADGFRGLRVSADATEMLRTPQQQDALARYEFMVSRYMAGHPLSAMCGFASELGRDTVMEFASLHDTGLTGEPAFRVFGCPDGALGLAGEFDPAASAALGRVLARLGAGADGGVLVVDLADVEYVDHRVLVTLSDYAQGKGVEVSLRSIPPFAARLMEFLPASYLRLAEVGAES